MTLLVAAGVGIAAGIGAGVIGGVAVGTAVGLGLGAASLTAGYEEYSAQSGIAKAGLGIAQTTQAEQLQYNQQLQQLIANPNAFFSSAPYQAAFAQGTKAVEYGQAAAGNPQGPGQAEALQEFGQTFGAQQLMSQEQLLAGLSGAGAASSPAQGVSAASGAQAQAGNTLSGLLASLGFSYGLYNQGGGYGGTPAPTQPEGGG